MNAVMANNDVDPRTVQGWDSPDRCPRHGGPATYKTIVRLSSCVITLWGCDAGDCGEPAVTQGMSKQAVRITAMRWVAGGWQKYSVDKP